MSLSSSGRVKSMILHTVEGESQVETVYKALTDDGFEAEGYGTVWSGDGAVGAIVEATVEKNDEASKIGREEDLYEG